MTAPVVKTPSSTPAPLARPASVHSTDVKNTGTTGKEVQPDNSKCQGTAGSTAGYGGKEEGSIRDGQTGYAGS
jgi:hypothetical protein